MDPECKAVFEPIVKAKEVLQILEMSQMDSLVKLMSLDRQKIQGIERDMSINLSINVPEHFYDFLEPYYRDNATNFKLKPVYVMRLLKASALLRTKFDFEKTPPKLLKRPMKRLCSSLNEDWTPAKLMYSPFAQLQQEYAMVPLKMNMSLPNIDEMKVIMDGLSDQRDGHSKAEEISMITGKLIHYVKTHFNTVLEHKNDFEVDYELSEFHGTMKKSGSFHCYICQRLRNKAKTVKFNITSGKNYYVFSNISTHLSKHFQKIQRRIYDFPQIL